MVRKCIWIHAYVCVYTVQCEFHLSSPQKPNPYIRIPKRDSLSINSNTKRLYINISIFIPRSW